MDAADELLRVWKLRITEILGGWVGWGGPGGHWVASRLAGAEVVSRLQIDLDHITMHKPLRIMTVAELT